MSKRTWYEAKDSMDPGDSEDNKSNERPAKRQKIDGVEGKENDDKIDDERQKSKPIKRGWDPDYPISSRNPSFTTIGVHLLRSVTHQAFQDGVVDIILGYSTEQFPLMELYIEDWEDGNELELVKTIGYSTRQQALREGLVRTPDLRIHDIWPKKWRLEQKHVDTIRFLEMAPSERRAFLSHFSESDLDKFERDIYDVMRVSPVERVIRSRTVHFVPTSEAAPARFLACLSDE